MSAFFEIFNALQVISSGRLNANIQGMLGICCWETVHEYFSPIRHFYSKEIAAHFPTPVTFLCMDVQNFLFHTKCSPIIPLQKSLSTLSCQTTLYLLFFGFRERGCVTSLFWPTCDTLLLNLYTLVPRPVREHNHKIMLRFLIIKITSAY